MAKLNLKAQTVFERHEKKYLLSSRQYKLLIAALEEHMAGDQYGLHTICSLYYDTPDYALIRHSLDKPAFKEKLRLRSYGVPDAKTRVFVELKKKLSGVTYKRRIPLEYLEAARYLDRGIVPSQTGQIFEEIDYFMKTRDLHAAMLLCYDRIALSGKEDPQLRLTIDGGIRFRTEQLDLSAGDFGTPLLSREQRLMEIKTPGAIPLWLSRLLSEHEIYATSFSKYGRAYQAGVVEQEVMRHAG